MNISNSFVINKAKFYLICLKMYYISRYLILTKTKLKWPHRLFMSMVIDIPFISSRYVNPLARFEVSYFLKFLLTFLANCYTDPKYRKVSL